MKLPIINYKSWRGDPITKQLTKDQIDALRRIRDRGSSAWCDGRGRAGGAVSRMFDLLRAMGLVTPPPYTITDAGRTVLADADT